MNVRAFAADQQLDLFAVRFEIFYSVLGKKLLHSKAFWQDEVPVSAQQVT